jgi:hypothetical protein
VEVRQLFPLGVVYLGGSGLSSDSGIGLFISNARKKGMAHETRKGGCGCNLDGGGLAVPGDRFHRDLPG